MTWRSQLQNKSQQPQLTDHPDRRMGHVHPQDQRKPQQHLRRGLDLRHHLSFARLLQPMRLVRMPVGDTTLLDATGV